MTTRNNQQIFIFGASGHAKVVIDIVERQGLYDIAFLVDDAPELKESSVYGYPVLGGMTDLLSSVGRPKAAIVAIGQNALRQKIAAQLEKEGVELVTAIHPSAQLAREVSVGGGTVIMAGAIVNSHSRIGRNVIINTGASVDHDCIVTDGGHIAPGATLCGGVEVGRGTFLGAGSTVIPNLFLGNEVVVGAGATVVCDVPDGTTVVGTPARRLDK